MGRYLVFGCYLTMLISAKVSQSMLDLVTGPHRSLLHHPLLRVRSEGCPLCLCWMYRKPVLPSALTHSVELKPCAYLKATLGSSRSLFCLLRRWNWAKGRLWSCLGSLPGVPGSYFFSEVLAPLMGSTWEERRAFTVLSDLRNLHGVLSYSPPGLIFPPILLFLQFWKKLI